MKPVRRMWAHGSSQATARNGCPPNLRAPEDAIAWPVPQCHWRLARRVLDSGWHLFVGRLRKAGCYAPQRPRGAPHSVFAAVRWQTRSDQCLTMALFFLGNVMRCLRVHSASRWSRTKARSPCRPAVSHPSCRGKERSLWIGVSPEPQMLDKALVQKIVMWFILTAAGYHLLVIM